MRINRNDLCWCNSGKKYKKCHMEFDERIENLAREGFEVPTRDIIKNEEQIEGIRKSAEINNAVLDLVAEKIKAGMSTEDINKIVHDYTVSRGAIPAPISPKNPQGLTASIPFSKHSLATLTNLFAFSLASPIINILEASE